MISMGGSIAIMLERYITPPVSVLAQQNRRRLQETTPTGPKEKSELKPVQPAQTSTLLNDGVQMP
jgi:hypothetical protein